jgi:sulfite reductase beta subunit-like hemoprotein
MSGWYDGESSMNGRVNDPEDGSLVGVSAGPYGLQVHIAETAGHNRVGVWLKDEAAITRLHDLVDAAFEKWQQIRKPLPTEEEGS